MVNLPGYIDDRFVPMTFEVLNCRTGEVEDLFEVTFGGEKAMKFGSEEVRRPIFEKASEAILASAF